MRWLIVLTVLALGCSASTESTDGRDGSAEGDASVVLTDAAVSGDAALEADAAVTFGRVTLEPIYEPGSAWIDNAQAQAMVDAVFADVSQTITTSGSWDATVQVYLTDDNPGTANTWFHETFSNAEVDGQAVKVVPAWSMIVEGRPDANGPGQETGEGVEFGIDYHVAGHGDNHGLLRHEIMHGLGAVNAVPNWTMSMDNMLGGGLVAGDSVAPALYDLAIVTSEGDPLLTYDAASGLFEAHAVELDPTFEAWTDGEAGLSFRGIDDAGAPYLMSLGTFPAGDGAVLVLNEPTELMSAGAHPTWNTLDAPDRAFLRALKYRVIGDERR